MNVYIIEITDAGDDRQDSPYDKWDSFMVCADNEQQAIKLAGYESYYDETLEEPFWTCRLVEKGDIVSSFNSG